MKETAIANLSRKDVFLHPFPHVDIQNAISDTWHRQILAELPSFNFLDETFHLSSKSQYTGYILDRKAIENKLECPAIIEFIEVHSSKEFQDQVLNIFDDCLDGHLPNHQKVELEPTEACILLHHHNAPPRPPHLDDARDACAFLYYLKPAHSNIQGGDLELYRHRDNFHGFDRIQINEDRRPKRKHLMKAKTIPYESNRFVLFLDGINSIHGVSPTRFQGNDCRFVMTGGLRSKNGEKLYDPSDYLTRKDQILDKLGYQLQKVRRKIRRTIRFS